MFNNIIKNYKIPVFFFILTVFSVFNHSLSADVYALIVGDTYSKDISMQVKKDMKLVKNETHEIASSLGTRAHVIMIDGFQAQRSSVLNAIDKMQIKNDDILIFYYSGHGCRYEEKESKWPVMYFSRCTQYLDLDEVIDTIKMKNIRFSLVIADCCNDFRTVPLSGPQKFSLAFNPGRKFHMSQHIGYLFKSSEGMIVLSAAKPGEYSWSTDFGGVLTLALMDELSEQKLEPQKRWESILQQIVKKTKNVQEPQYAIMQN